MQPVASAHSGRQSHVNPVRTETADCREWTDAWRARRTRSGLEANLRRAGLTQEQFWSRYASWVGALQHNGYPGVLLDRVMDHVRADSTVLDIGAGTGTFALPLARVVRHVTAIEPSPAQTAHLHDAARHENVRNLTVIERRWEDLVSDEPATHNVVLAAHSLQMDDLTQALRRMCKAASERLLLIHTAGHSLSDLLHELFGIEPGPDYLFPYHVLCGLGYRPQIELVTRECHVNLDLQLDIFQYNPGLSPAQCDTLREYAESEGLVHHRHDASFLQRSYTDALITVTS